MFRPTRRGLAALVALPAALCPRPGHADAARASAFIQATGEELTAAINDPGLTPAARRAKVGAILRRAVDVEGVGRFILGRWWRTASPAEQQDYAKLFDDWLIHNLAARFGEYQGVRFTVGRTQARTEEDVLVNTMIERQGSPSFSLDWRVADAAGGPRVVDVIAEGTSLRLTQRSEYGAVVQRNGGQVAPLLDAMRTQVAQLAAKERTR
jgi:phospholipid transport system substrate-binding protein